MHPFDAPPGKRAGQTVPTRDAAVVGLRPPPRPPRGLVAAIEHLGDLIDPLGARGGVARGGPQVDVPEPRRDLVGGDAGLEQMGGPVEAQSACG